VEDAMRMVDQMAWRHALPMVVVAVVEEDEDEREEEVVVVGEHGEVQVVVDDSMVAHEGLQVVEENGCEGDHDHDYDLDPLLDHDLVPDHDHDLHPNETSDDDGDVGSGNGNEIENDGVDRHDVDHDCGCDRDRYCGFDYDCDSEFAVYGGLCHDRDPCPYLDLFLLISHVDGLDHGGWMRRPIPRPVLQMRMEEVAEERIASSVPHAQQR